MQAMKTSIKFLRVLILMLALMLPWAGKVHAANNWMVTKTDDTNDGACDADCSIREAIAVSAAGDTITVPPGTYNLWLSHLWINKDLTINGSGVGSTIIQQTNSLFRVFDIGNGGFLPPLPIVSISRLTVKGGHATSPSNSEALPGHTHGGGIHNHGILFLTNVTVTGNNAQPDTGGGLYSAGSGANATLFSVTIKDNTTLSGGGGIVNTGTIALVNSILADNSPANCVGTIGSGGNNLDSGDTCMFRAAGDLINTNPLLGPLTNGVYPLLGGSPAIDAGTSLLCPATDQIGTLRPQGAACDIGAFEFIPPDLTPPVIVADVAPPPNANGWNNTDVTVTWNVSDPESGIASSSGCDAMTLTSETSGTTLICSATNGASLSSSESVTVKIDKTPPTVTYTGNAGTYTFDQTVNIACSAADNLSGVGSTTCADISGPASSFGPGTHTFSATATDMAGNVGNGSTTFTVSNPPAVARVFIDAQEMPGSPFGLAPGVSVRKSFPGVNAGPVKVEGNVDIVAAERVIHRAAGGVNASFSEMMGLPANQLDNTYWLPWYNNRTLDTQLRFANVTGSTASVHVFIGEEEMTGSPFTLLAGESTRKSFFNINAGPVQIVSDRNIVAAQRVIYRAASAVNASFSEMMALPDNQLDTTYWLPWYNNVGLDTQLRFANTSEGTAHVHVFIGGDEMTGSPFTLLVGESIRKSFPGINAGPVEIVSDQNLVAAQRVIYRAASAVNASFSEMMALSDNQLDTTYWLPWYNNRTLDTQLRFANTSGSTATVHVFIGEEEMAGSPFTLPAGESIRKSFPGVNAGPVQIVSNRNIVAAQRVIYKVNTVINSFSEMMALPHAQLDMTYWFPWYNNVGLDTQLRFGMP
jgi:CSLREA domain-containing protein